MIFYGIFLYMYILTYIKTAILIHIVMLSKACYWKEKRGRDSFPTLLTNQMTIPFNKLPWTWDCCCCEEFCNKDELLWSDWTFCSCCCWACFEDEFLCGMGSTAGVCWCFTSISSSPISASFPVPVPGTGVIVTLPFIFLIRTWGPLLRLLAAAAALLLGVEFELAFPFPVRVWLLPPEVEEGAATEVVSMMTSLSTHTVPLFKKIGHHFWK